MRVSSSLWVSVSLPGGGTVWWDGRARVSCQLPPSYTSSTRGLCGTLTGSQQDELLSPQGDLESSAAEFAARWQTEPGCQAPQHTELHPCDAQPHRRAEAEAACGALRGELFKSCQTELSPEPAYRACLAVVCSCPQPRPACLCPALAAYAEQCTERGVMVDWRAGGRECGLHCPAGQQYQQCGDCCRHSCGAAALPGNCTQHCVEGCTCPAGLALSQAGDCIPLASCPCSLAGATVPAGTRDYRAGSGLLCTCTGADWRCQAATEEETAELAPAVECGAGREPGGCPQSAPRSCTNLHLTSPGPEEDCRPGCVCQPGTVEDGAGNCVAARDCPCHHAGRSYNEGDTVQQQCNTWSVCIVHCLCVCPAPYQTPS